MAPKTKTMTEASSGKESKIMLYAIGIPNPKSKESYLTLESFSVAFSLLHIKRETFEDELTTFRQ